MPVAFRRGLFFTLVLAVSLTANISCSNRKTENPREQIANAYVELIRANLVHEAIRPDSILRSLGLDSVVFVEHLDRLANDPAQLKAFLEQVVARIDSAARSGQSAIPR